MLKGTNRDGKGVFILDSGAELTPFSIGSDFSVSWNGELNCSKVISLNNDGNNNKAISIANNFYVTQSGGAGGSGVSFSGGFGGYFNGKGDFTEIIVTEKADLPNPISVGGTSIKLRTNTFVTSIKSFTGEVESIEIPKITGVTLQHNGGPDILTGSGTGVGAGGVVSISTSIIPNAATLTTNGNYTIKSFKGATLTLSTLKGTYLGTDMWSTSEVKRKMSVTSSS